MIFTSVVLENKNKISIGQVSREKQNRSKLFRRNFVKSREISPKVEEVREKTIRRIVARVLIFRRIVGEPFFSLFVT